MSKEIEYCKCCRCRNIHPYTDRIAKDGEFTKEYGIVDIVCPRCGALNYYSVDKQGNKVNRYE